MTEGVNAAAGASGAAAGTVRFLLGMCEEQLK